MLQHTSSEVIIIQLQINLNSKIQLYSLRSWRDSGVQGNVCNRCLRSVIPIETKMVQVKEFL